MYTFKGTSGKPGDIDGGTRGESSACDSQSTLPIWGPCLCSLMGLMSFVEVVLTLQNTTSLELEK